MKIVLIVLVLLAFAAEADPDGALGLTSIVSTRDPNLQIPAAATLTWRESAITVHQDQRLDTQSVTAAFRDAIEAAVVNRGYRMAAAGSAADFELGFLLALSSSLDDQQILRQFGFSPGLQGANTGNLPEKGTLVVILIDPRNGRSMWRGAIQAFTKLSASETERAQRAAAAANKLMELMPDVP